MAFSYSISYGIAGGFIMYCIVKTLSLIHIYGVWPAHRFSSLAA